MLALLTHSLLALSIPSRPAIGAAWSATAVSRPAQPLVARSARCASPNMLWLEAGVDGVSFTDAFISNGVTFDTFVPQPFWILMIAAGGTKVSKKVMGDYGIGVILVLGLVHLAIVVLAASENGGEGTAPILLFADEFDPSKDQLGVMTQLFAFRNFCAEEWPHVLIWDLFVGRAVWRDGLSRGIVTWHSVLLTNLIGPPGLVLHALTCLFTGNALPLAVGGSVPEEE